MTDIPPESKIKHLEDDLERLRGLIGSWRRKAQDKSPNRYEVFKEGYNRFYNEHYKVFVVDSIPGDLPIKEVLKELKSDFLPKVEPFHFKRVDYSTKFETWIVEVSRVLDYDLLDLEK